MKPTEGHCDERTHSMRIVRENDSAGQTPSVHLVDDCGMQWHVADLHHRRLELSTELALVSLGTDDARCRAFVRDDQMTKLHTFGSDDDHESDDSALLTQFRGAEFVGRISPEATMKLMRSRSDGIETESGIHNRSGHFEVLQRGCLVFTAGAGISAHPSAGGQRCDP